VTEPYSLTRPRSLRPRSTSITCSARSFSSFPHLLFKTQIFGLVAAPRMCTRDRTVFQFCARSHAPAFLAKSLESESLHPQEIKIRRRIHLSERAVKVEGLNPWDEVEPLRKYHLKNVSCGNVFLTALHTTQKFARVVPESIFNFPGLALLGLRPHRRTQPRKPAFFPARQYRAPPGHKRAAGFRG